MVISAFPGTGKTHLYKSHKLNMTIYDSDSSKFSWLESGERNPNFVNDYCDYIEKIQKKKGNHLQLISSHKEIRDELKRRDLDKLTYEIYCPKCGVKFRSDLKYALIYPAKSLKNEYIERYKKRGSPDSFVKLMDTKWDEMIDSCEQDTDAIKILLISNEYINDIVDWFILTKIDDKQIINKDIEFNNLSATYCDPDKVAQLHPNITQIVANLLEDIKRREKRLDDILVEIRKLDVEKEVLSFINKNGLNETDISRSSQQLIQINNKLRELKTEAFVLQQSLGIKFYPTSYQ